MKDRNAIPFELDSLSWMDGADPDSWPRSRYSGAAMYPDQMTISTVALWPRGITNAGHTYLVFEWYDSSLDAPRTSQRRHEIYDLIPKSEASSGAQVESSQRSVTTDEGEIRFFDDLKYFPRFHRETREMIPAYFRSWRNRFEDGWKAREKALADQQNPPRFNLLTLGGLNCSKWAIETAAVAGIDPRTPIAKLLGVPIPIVENYFGDLVEEEEIMWCRRNVRKHP